MSKPWWQLTEDMIDGVELGSAPVSLIWRKKVGRFDPFDQHASSSERQRLERALNMLARTANVVKNSKKDERELFIKFGDGSEINMPNSPTIILSPDSILSHPPEEDELNIDGLTGKVLTLSAMKRTMHMRPWQLNGTKQGGLHELTKPIWQAIETVIARQDVLTDWLGFAPYFKRHQEQVGGGKDKVESIIMDNIGQPSAELAAVLLCWNMLNPSKPITIPEQYRYAIEDAEDCMRAPVAPESRYDRAGNVAEILLNHFPEPPAQSTIMVEVNVTAIEMAKALTDPEVFGATIPSYNKADLPAAKEVTDEELEEFNRPIVPSGCDPLKHPTVVTRYEDRNPKPYRNAITRLRYQIGQVRNVMRFRNEVHQCNRGLPSGELDSGSLYKLSYQKENPAIWERRSVRSVANLAIGLLLDESGSMGTGDEHGVSRIDKARDVLITMYEALRHAQGLQMLVLGHSANSGRSPEQSHQTLRVTHKPAVLPKDLWMLEYITPQTKSPNGLLHSKARSNNLDGYAMEYAIRRLAFEYDAPTKVLFVISDGTPNANGYGDAEAWRHMNNVCQFGKTLGVQTYGIGVDNAYTSETGEAMYGKDQFIVLNDVTSSISVLTGFIRPLAKKVI